MTTDLKAKMDALRESRDATGQNVRFINDDGQPDCFSFSSKERAEAFRSNLAKRGVTILN